MDEHEQQNSKLIERLEAELRKAEEAMERAGQILCPVRGNVAPALFGQCNVIVAQIQNIIHETWRLAV